MTFRISAFCSVLSVLPCLRSTSATFISTSARAWGESLARTALACLSRALVDCLGGAASPPALREGLPGPAAAATAATVKRLRPSENEDILPLHKKKV